MKFRKSGHLGCSSFNNGGLDMNKLTREEALRRWKSAKATKKAMVDKMQKMLYRRLQITYRRGACEI